MATSTPYEELLAAGDSLTSVDPEKLPETLTDGELSAHLDSNCDPLLVIHRVLRQPFRGPPITREAYPEGMRPLAPIRNIAQTLKLELLAADRRNDLDKVIELGVECLRLGNGIRHGGLNVEMLYSLAVQAVGLDGMRKVRRRLTAEQGTRLARLVLETEVDREPLELISQRDREWELTSMRAAGLTCEPNSEEHIEAIIAEYKAQGEDFPAEEFKKFWREAQSQLSEEERRKPSHWRFEFVNLAAVRMLAIEASLIAHQKKTGSYPADLADLVPDQLFSMPPDPFTGRDFRYRRTKSSYELTSPALTAPGSAVRLGFRDEVLAGRSHLCMDVDDYYSEPALNIWSRARRWFGRWRLRSA